MSNKKRKSNEPVNPSSSKKGEEKRKEKIKEAFLTMIMSREEALEDQKKRYGTPGDPLYMGGIQTIKKHY